MFSLHDSFDKMEMKPVDGLVHLLLLAAGAPMIYDGTFEQKKICILFGSPWTVIEIRLTKKKTPPSGQSKGQKIHSGRTVLYGT